MFTTSTTLAMTPILARRGIVGIVEGLREGDAHSWIFLGITAGVITFFYLYEKITGKSYVKSKEERREARRRRGKVVWEFKRDD